MEINKSFFIKVAYSFLTVGVLGVLYSAYLFTHQVQIARDAQLASLLSPPSARLADEEKPLQIGLRVKSADCEIQGPLPDSDCTPGSIFPNATKDEICVSGYSKKVRNVSTKLKKKVFSQYGISYPVPFGSYEVDHLIPLALGGNNDIANLWPKSAQPFPGFYEKNIVGNYLHEEVCANRVDLSVAQKRIANSWFLIYNSIDPKIIEELKKKYRNWAD